MPSTRRYSVTCSVQVPSRDNLYLISTNEMPRSLKPSLCCSQRLSDPGAVFSLPSTRVKEPRSPGSGALEAGLSAGTCAFAVSLRTAGLFLALYLRKPLTRFTPLAATTPLPGTPPAHPGGACTSWQHSLVSKLGLRTLHVSAPMLIKGGSVSRAFFKGKADLQSPLQL